MSIFTRKKDKEKPVKEVAEKDLIEIRNRYAEFLKETASNNENKFLTNGGKNYAILLLKELLRNTRYVARIFCNDDNIDIWSDKEFVDFINNIVTEKQIVLRILTTNRMFFDNLPFSKNNVFISEISEKGLKSIYDHFKNENCSFAVFDNKGFRYEYDSKEINSYANFNDKEVATLLINLFENAIL